MFPRSITHCGKHPLRWPHTLVQTIWSDMYIIVFKRIEGGNVWINMIWKYANYQKISSKIFHGCGQCIFNNKLCFTNSITEHSTALLRVPPPSLQIFTHVILLLNRKAHAVYINTVGMAAKFINPAHLQMRISLISPPLIKKVQPFKSCKATSVIYSSHKAPVLSSLITVSYGFNTSVTQAVQIWNTW